MSYYYFQYSDISSVYINAIEASFNQMDPALSGLSVAQCANYGISLMNDYDASFMVLTTDVSGVENKPRLEYYNPSSFSTDMSATFIYSPETSSNINKQVFCSKDTAYAALTDDISGSVAEDAIINDEAIEQYDNFPYDGLNAEGTSTVPWDTYFDFPTYPGPDMSLIYQDSITSGTSPGFVVGNDYISSSQTAIDASCVIVRKEIEISGNNFGFCIGTQATTPSPITNKRFVIGCYNSGHAADSGYADASGIAVVYNSNTSATNPSSIGPFYYNAILNPLQHGDGTAGKSPIYSVSISSIVDGNCIIALGQPFDVSSVTVGSTIYTRPEGSVSIYHSTTTNNSWTFRTRLYAKGPSTTDGEQWNGWPTGGANGNKVGSGYSQNGGFLFGWSVSCGSPYIVAVGAPHVRSIKGNNPSSGTGGSNSSSGYSESPWSWAGQVYIYRVKKNQTYPYPHGNWDEYTTVLISCVYPPRLLLYSFEQPPAMNNFRLNPNPHDNTAGCGSETGPFNETHVSEFGRKVSLQCLSTDSDNSNNLILVVGAPLYPGYANMGTNRTTSNNLGTYFNYYQNWLELDSSAGAAWGTGCVCCYYSADYGENWSGGWEENIDGSGIPTKGIHCGNGKIWPDQCAYRSLVTKAPRYPDIDIWGATNIFPTPVRDGDGGGGINVGGFFNNRNPDGNGGGNYCWQVSATGIILNPAYGGNDSTFNASDIPGTGDGHTTKWGAAPTMFGYDIATSALGSNWSDGVGLIITSPGFVEPISSFVTHPGFRGFPNKIESISGPTLFDSQNSTSEYGNWYDASASVLGTTGNKNTRIYIYKNSCTGFTGDTTYGGTQLPSGSGYSLLDSSYILTATMEFNTNDFGAGGSISFLYPRIVVGWGPVSARDNIYSHNIFKYEFTSNSLEDPVETDKLFYNNAIGLSQNLNPQNFGIVVAVDTSYTFISSLPVLQEPYTSEGAAPATAGAVSLIEWDVSLNSGSTKQVFFLEDVSFANPILFTPQTWTDNSNIPVTPSTYFQYSNKTDDSIDSITINAPQIADFSNNFSLCAQYASRYLGTGGINAAGEEKERKYFVLYANDTNTANRRITFLSDISGAYFNNGSTGTEDISGRQIFCSVQDTSAVTDAYWDGTDMSMASATPFYFDENKWMKEEPSAPNTVMYYALSNILDNTICEFPVGTFSSKTTPQMAFYANKFLGQTLVDASGIPRECKYYVLYTNDLSDNRIEFKYDYSGGTYDAISNCEDVNTQVFCSSANALNIWNNKTTLEWDYMVSPTVDISFANDVLGVDVAVANNMVLGGAPGTSHSNGSTLAGGRVLTWYTDNSGETWIEKTTIDNPVPQQGAYFGRAVALSYITSSTYLACIAAYKADNDGMVYIYKTLNNGDTWSMTQELKGSDYLFQNQDEFGYPHVALKAGNYSDNVLAVSAGYYNSVFVFSANTYDSSWNIIDTLHDPGPLGDISSNTQQGGYSTRFGLGLAIDENFILVGAPGDGESDTQDIYGGAAYLFKITAPNSSLNFYQTLEPFDISNGDYFGSSCSIDGNLCVIGCAIDTNSDISGSAFVFKGTNDTSWNQTAKLIDYLEPLWNGVGPAPNFGGSVSIKNNIIIVGANDDVYYTNGTISIFFSPDEGLSWTQIRKLQSLDPGTDKRFGSSVALSDNYAVVGEPMVFNNLAALNRGAIYVIPKSLMVDTTSNISNAKLRVYTNNANWVGNCNDVSMTYFQYSNHAGDSTKNIFITDLEIADFSNNYAKCSQYASQFLGAVSFDGNSEIIDNRYFILYADDTNSANKRIAFFSDISGTVFNQTDFSGRQIFCQLGDTSNVNSAYWSGTDNSMSYSTPLYFTEEGWLKTTPTPPDSNFYFQWSDILSNNIFDLPIGELPGQAFDGSSIAQMANYGTSFLNKMLVDTAGVPRECKYFVLYTDDSLVNRIQFKYDVSINENIYRFGSTGAANVSGSKAAAIAGEESSMSNLKKSDYSFLTNDEFITLATFTLINNYGPDCVAFTLIYQNNERLEIDKATFKYSYTNLYDRSYGTENPTNTGQQVYILERDLEEAQAIIDTTLSGDDTNTAVLYKNIDTLGAFYGPKGGFNNNKQIFCSSANAIEIKQNTNNINITGVFDCSFANEIKFFEDKWADNNQLVAPPTSFFRTSNIVAEYDGSANPQVDIISYNAPQLYDISNNYAECAAYASKFLGTIGLTDPSGTGNWEEKERKYFVLITDDTDPSAARIQFKYDASGAYYDPSCGSGGLATNCQIFCPTTDVVPLQEAPGPDYEPYQSDIGTNTMANSHPRYFSG